MKYILGISAGFHDAAVTVLREDGEILFAGHSERYSKIKNDPTLHSSLLEECCEYQFDTVAFYERPWMHNIQQWRSGQKLYGPWTTLGAIKKYLGDWYQNRAVRELSFPHHLSHAAAGFQTSPFDEAAVLVIDAIGELDTISIYHATYVNGKAKYKKVWGQQYPHSIGLFYSAITEYVGLKPMDEEYITMGMSAWGNKGQGYLMDQYIDNLVEIKFNQNFHIGIDPGSFGNLSNEDVAAEAQAFVENLICHLLSKASKLVGSKNLVYMGGVALNCLANKHIGRWFERHWIMPNPGDAGSSLGAAALAHGGKINWKSPYLGYDISGPYPVKDLLDELIKNKIVGVANGRAEFGPRALGNRSLLADPRGPEIKDQVNEIKRRQKFRPFAPVILEECVADYFEMPENTPVSPYMQVVARCREPEKYPAIVHVDGTSRVQTVSKDCGSGIRQLLEQWYLLTGCPMLLNTSLNIRGEPMVNDRIDANRFEKQYGIRVCS